jgi:hypothetical protein
VTAGGSTVRLRLVGITPMQLAAAAVAAAPLGFVMFQIFARHAALHSPLLVAACAAVALVPWGSRAVARASYRAKCDDIAVHAGAEALPYKTIKEVRVERTPRRVYLHLVRSPDIELVLVLRDSYAGRLEPLATLRERLAKHGFSVEEP